MVSSKDIAEDIRKKLQIAEATMEGVVRRMEDYSPDDDVVEGMEWAFMDLKDSVERLE